MMKPKSKKNVSTSKPLIVKGSIGLSRPMYYALIGVITEVLSDLEKEKKERLLKDPKGDTKVDKLNEPKIAQDIYDKIGKIYPTSTFNVVILNLVGGEFQFKCSKESAGFLSVASGNRIFNIFKL